MSHIGRKGMVGIGKQADFATEAAALVWVPVDEYNMNPVQEYVRDESARGRIERASDTNMAMKHSEPSFSGKMYDKLFGHLLRAAFGTVATSANSPESGVNTHALSVKNDNAPNYYTIVFKDDVHTQKILGAALNTLEITVNKDQEVTYSASFIGVYPVDGTFTPSYTAQNLFMSRQTTLKLASAIAGLGAASAVSYESLSLSINKNASRQGVASDGNPERIINGTFEVSGDIEMVFLNETYYDHFTAKDDRAIRITIVNSDVTIGAASNPKLTIDLALVNLKEWAKSNGLDDEVRQTFSIEPDYSIADSEMISAELINTETSY